MESGKYIYIFNKSQNLEKKTFVFFNKKLGPSERKLPDQKTNMGGWLLTTHAQFCVDIDPTFFQWE
jgi:hypothetical protein